MLTYFPRTVFPAHENGGLGMEGGREKDRDLQRARLVTAMDDCNRPRPIIVDYYYIDWDKCWNGSSGLENRLILRESLGVYK